MSPELLDQRTWEGQAPSTIRQAAAEYRVWADREDQYGFPRLAADMRRLADRLDRLYLHEEVS